MEDETNTLVDKAQELGDLELAVLLCLIANEHCIIEADHQDLKQAEKELQSICSNTFGLKSAIVHCDADLGVDSFAEHLLVQDEGDEPVTPVIRLNRREKDSFFQSDDASMQRTGQALDDGEGKRIADVVIVKDLNLACSQVQIQALELMRGSRIYTRKAMYTTPKGFLLIALNNAESGPRMVVHLNDHFHISHFYQSLGDDAQDDIYQHRNGSTGSVVRSRPATPGFMRSTSYRSYMKPLISHRDITTLSSLAGKVKLHPDVRAYMHNIIVFMRMHRAVASGVTPHATRHLYALTQSLAPLHGLDFITPSLVALAVRKIYPHRLTIVAPEDEMSLQWGSDVEAVREYLDGVTGEDVIEDVLERVETPL